MTETVSFVVHLPAKTEQREAFMASLLPVLNEMSKEPDFVNTYLHRSLQDPDTLVLYETWACSKDEFLAKHLTKPYRVAYEAQLGEMLKAPRSIEFLEPVRAFG
ncbi:Quinol monooxygenase YgiN [Roseateles sp. YR242]|uniref:putative quinol monooxygenase n=1 Tax=Roseateles sp. YR242 TaxID=1855305 RepID=UPI0008D541A7|nr:antibiotic biosynthesis monooxygenase [Roseateles sp. YR242]SEL01506.1 Quinol monooxygenase YgiN [Roseateles sp. YR242]